jgi:hypothetical protein
MEKIKQFIESEQGKDILIVIIVILVGLASFELGRLSKSGSSSGIKIEYPNQQTNTISAKTALGANIPTTINSGKNFFASSRGTKYYSLGCSGGKTIKQDNRIYFATGTEAETAGYELSSTCK